LPGQSNIKPTVSIVKIDRVLCDAGAEAKGTVAYRAYVTTEKVFNVRYEFN